MVDMNHILKELTNDFKENKRIFIKYYKRLDSFDGLSNTLYHQVMMSDASIELKKLAISTLIHYKVNYNIKNLHGDTIIHTAIQHNNDMNFILDTLHCLCVNGFDINTTNNLNYTLLHMSLLYTENYNDIIKLINYISRYNFNFKVLDKYNRTLIDYVKFSKKIPLIKKGKIIELIQEGIGNMNYKDIFDKEIETSEEKKEPSEKPLNRKGRRFNPLKYGIILNDKNYPSEPAIGREEEVNNLIVSLNTEKKLPLLVGPSGVGKTAIVDELAYLIQNDLVPPFLTNKIIYEINISRVTSGTYLRGGLEEHMQEIIDYALTNDAILFFDEMHNIRGAGASTDDKNDIANILKMYIDRYGIKVIGATTTGEYEEHLSKDALKRRFDVIKVSELSDDKLHDVIVNAIDNNITKKELKISDIFLKKLDEIIDILIELTGDKHRVYNDKLYNPDLVLSIIERSFAYPAVYSESEYDIKHLILGINNCERINPSAREMAIKKMYYLTQNNTNEAAKKKALIIDIREYQKSVRY